MILQKSLAQIKKTKNKKFRVNYFGKNGEPLSNSEVLNTRNNAKKNIVAMLNICGGQFFEVLDISSHAVRRFTLDRAGKETDINVM